MNNENPLAGVPLITAETHGTLSQLALMAQAAAKLGVDPLAGLTDAELLALYYEPDLHLRPTQRPPAEYRTFFLSGGRGAGKTYGGAAAVVAEAQADPEARIMITGPTYSEIVKNQIEGPSGILTICPPWFQPKYEIARRKLTFPSGAQATWLPATRPQKFRGFASSLVWADELVAWEDDYATDTLNEIYRISRVQTNRMKTLGLSPRVIITTTPESSPTFRYLLNNYKQGMVVARSPTMENRAYLDPSYVAYANRLSNTAAGRKEFAGILSFDDLDAAMFKNVNWNASRVDVTPDRFDDIYVSVDPSTGQGARHDTCAIIVVGIRLEPDGFTHAYVLQDKSINTSVPTVWARLTVDAYHAWRPLARRTFISAETNTGGHLVKSVLKQVDNSVRIRTYRAGEQKALRAAPVSGMAEAGLVHMIGRHPDLERELSYFTGAENEKNDRVDAMASCIYMWVVKRNKTHNINASDADDDE
jgi:phage terminase large subunit-like protein